MKGVQLSVVRWAEQHDWFVEAEEIGSNCYIIHAVERWWIPETKEEGADPVSFTSFAELRGWAGY